ncbi:asparagine synthase (glutamine-hydrolyzing) [bacterium]|nr:asparagine synthase (glutamine-hydrolyzing) [bacterium]
MCGITGFIHFNRDFSTEDSVNIASKMADTLYHRGPDYGNVWVDAKHGIGLGHRRLSIMDLSSEGSQPMISRSGRFVLVFNGEIYNFQEIRNEVEENLQADSTIWKGRSDTEVLLAGFELWSVPETLRRLVGMFAFALWDKKESTLFLARDRIGEKPLFYGVINNTLLFGSELKALKAHPHWKGEISRSSLVLFLRFNYLPSPYSIYNKIFKLPQGTFLEIKWIDHFELPKPTSYWSPPLFTEKLEKTHPEESEQETVRRLENLLKDSVKKRLVSDVPVGVFLSGGIDSTTVASLAKDQYPAALKTFTIGFHEDGYNEANYAKEVAKHLGTDHTELYVDSKEAMDVIPKLPVLFDEPFSDSSQIPTFLLAKLAKKEVTVCLSGDGGDEIFGGYNRYFWGEIIWKTMGWVPHEIKQGISNFISSRRPLKWQRVWKDFSFLVPNDLRVMNFEEKLQKVAKILSAKSPGAFYNDLVSDWPNPEGVVLGGKEPPTILTSSSKYDGYAGFAQRMMSLDFATYLPDDILVKLDRACMGVSLEARTPFLDHRIVEFALKMPLSVKIRKMQGKWILRQILYKYVPQKLVERPKMGLGVPIGFWLRGPLRDWAETLLSERRIKEEGFFNVKPIRQKWLEHLSGEKNWQNSIWSILMFQAWLENDGISQDYLGSNSL